jgi:hypothetical protein
MRGTNGRSRNARPFRVIPVRGQRPEYGIQPPNKQRCDVLHEDVSGSKHANHAGEFVPESRTLAHEPGALAGEANVLAGEPPADEVNGCEVVGSDFSHILVSLGVGEVAFEDSPAVLVLLDLPCRSHPGPLKAEVESPDSCEKASDIHTPTWA